MNVLSRFTSAFQSPTMDEVCRQAREREADLEARRAEAGVEILPEEYTNSSKRPTAPDTALGKILSFTVPHYRLVPQRTLFMNPAEQLAFVQFQHWSERVYSLILKKRLKLNNEDYRYLHGYVNNASAAVGQLNANPTYRKLLERHLAVLVRVRSVARCVADVVDPFPENFLKGY